MKELNKNDLASDIDELAYLLNSFDLCGDTGPLYKAQGICLRDSTEEVWKHDLASLIFRIPAIGHTIPHSVEEINLSLSLKLDGIFLIDNVEIKNPLNSLEFNIEINGTYEFENTRLPVISSWHLDKHLSSQTGDLTKYIHPEYHFTYGGRKMWDKSEFNYGQALILPTPRLIHPPLDIILGVDFVLQNYFKIEVHSKLTSGLDYKRLVSKAQERLWRPYFLTIANSYSNMTGLNFNNCIQVLNLIPNLVVN